jgi:hypothetical protein
MPQRHKTYVGFLYLFLPFRREDTITDDSSLTGDASVAETSQAPESHPSSLPADQEAACSYVQALEAGATNELPLISLVPGHAMVPLQALSAAAFEASRNPAALPYFPTVGEARKAARAAFREGLPPLPLEELSHLKRALRHVAAPSAAFPREMALRGGHPGLKPSLPTALEHQPAPAGHIPLLNAPRLVAAHAEFCDDCKAGSPCYINSYASLLESGYDTVWDEGGPTPPSHKPDKRPAAGPEGASLAALVGKWAGKGAVSITERANLVNPCHGFVATTSAVPLTPAMAAVIATGGSAAHRALWETAGVSANNVWAAYVANLGAGSPHITAWSNAVSAAGGSPKERMICAPEDMNDHSATLSFSHMSLGDLLKHIRPGWVFAKLDLKNFFYNFKISKELRKRLGFPFWEGDSLMWAQLERLAMGAHGSPFWACLGSSVIHEVFRARLLRDGLAKGFTLEEMVSLVYCDDFCLAAPNKTILTFMMSTLRTLLRELDLEVSEEKTCQPGADGLVGATKVVFLGLTVTSAPPSIAVPPEGLAKTARALILLRNALQEENRALGVPSQLMASAGGLVSRLLEASPSLGPLSRALVSTFRHGPRRPWTWDSAHGADQAAALRADAVELLAAIGYGGWDGSPLRPLRPLGDKRYVHVTSDFGCSGVDRADRVSVIVNGVAACVFLLKDTGGVTVPNLELLGVVFFLIRYGLIFRGFRVVMGIDSVCAVQWLEKRRASCPCANNLIALILRLELRLEMHLSFQWLSRYANYAADRLCTGRDAAALRAEGVPGIPLALEHVTVEGLPCDFLRQYANSVVWKDALWHEVHVRS